MNGVCLHFHLCETDMLLLYCSNPVRLRCRMGDEDEAEQRACMECCATGLPFAADERTS